MNNQAQPTVRSGETLPMLDGTNDHLIFDRAFWNKIIGVAQAVLATKAWQVTENGLLIKSPGGTSAGSIDIAQYNPAENVPKGAIRFFTPDGEAAGTFYSLQAVPPGISPDTGAPFWADFPQAPAGIWA